MKKVIPGLICLLLISSCGFETPESITIKGNPSLYVPVGSPFATIPENERLENLISPEHIKEMIETSALDKRKVNIYDIVTTINPGVRTYLVQYPVDSIPLNLQEYMNRAMDVDDKPKNYTIPEVSDLPSGTYYIDGKGEPHTKESDIGDNPFLKIPLDNMVKFVQEVKRNAGDKFGLEISVVNSNSTQFNNLEQNLQLKIPSIGINTYIPGVPNPDDLTKLQFVNNDGTPFKPREDLINGELWIYARISGPCSGTIKPAIVYEWREAVINTPEDNYIEQSFPIGKNNLTNLFEGAASFKKVSGYVYIYGTDISDPIKMTYTYRYNRIDRYLIAIKNLPDFTKGNLTPTSFYDRDEPLDMTEFFNNADGELVVNISIPVLHIINDGSFDKQKNIECILCVLIPLDLDIKELSNKEAPDKDVSGVNIKNTYVPLYLGNNLQFGSGEDDLFGRTDGSTNLNMKIDYVDILLEDIDITVMDPKRLAVLIKSNGVYKLLKFDKANATLRFSGDSIGDKFNPEFTILLEKDTPGVGGSGSFSVLRNSVSHFDFKLYVKAKAALEYTLGL